MKKILCAILLTFSLNSFAFWQVIADDLISQGYCKSSIVLGHDGSIFAINNFSIHSGEAAPFVSLFNDSQAARTNGLNMGGLHYQTRTADSSTLLGTDLGAFIYAKKTLTAVLLCQGNMLTEDLGVSRYKINRIANEIIASGN